MPGQWRGSCNNTAASMVSKILAIDPSRDTSVSKILAIDPSTTNMGLYDGQRSLLISATAKLRAERLGFICEALSTFMSDYGPYDFVVYEEQFQRGDAATRCLYGIVGVIEAVANLCGAGVMPVPQGTLRSWAALQGVDPKLKGKELYAKVAALYDDGLASRKVSEHEMDAACVYHFVRDKAIIG